MKTEARGRLTCQQLAPWAPPLTSLEDESRGRASSSPHLRFLFFLFLASSASFPDGCRFFPTGAGPRPGPGPGPSPSRRQRATRRRQWVRLRERDHFRAVAARLPPNLTSPHPIERLSASSTQAGEGSVKGNGGRDSVPPSHRVAGGLCAPLVRSSSPWPPRRPRRRSSSCSAACRRACGGGHLWPARSSRPRGCPARRCSARWRRSRRTC